MIDTVGLVFLGFGSALFASMVGLGMGGMAVPVMLAAGFAHPIAVSSALFATFVTSVTSTVAYARQGRINYRLGITIAACAVPGTAIGSGIVDDVGPESFKILFAAGFLAIASYMIITHKVPKGSSSRGGPRVWIACTAASFGGGILSSFYGIGGGVVFVPVIVMIMGLGMHRAAPTSHLVIAFVAASGMLLHTYHDNSSVQHLLPLAGGALAGTLVGSRISGRIRQSYLQAALVAFMIIAGTGMMLQALAG